MPAPDPQDAPLVATIAGIEVVTIPLHDYADLIRGRNRLMLLEKDSGFRRRMGRSPIDKDAKIKAFIIERLGKLRLVDIAAACKEAFGQRAPSKSAIHRFQHRREAVSPKGAPNDGCGGNDET